MSWPTATRIRGGASAGSSRSKTRKANRPSCETASSNQTLSFKRKRSERDTTTTRLTISLQNGRPSRAASLACAMDRGAYRDLCEKHDEYRSANEGVKGLDGEGG